MTKPEVTPVLLVIRDGWGFNPHPEQDAFNAIKLANTPYDAWLKEKWPRTLIAASGLDVGVPVSVMGNSEVGHQNIGAGRIVDQEIVRITKALETGEIGNNAVWKAAIDRVKKNGTRLHLMGLVSDAGVHSLLEHLYGLLGLAKRAGVEQVFVHAFMDGRDTSPTSGVRFIQQLEKKLSEIGVGRVASVCGRFWCMDRDNRWDRVERAYNMLTGRKAEATASSAEAGVQQYYENPVSDSQKGDEFVPATWVVDDAGNPLATIADGDSVVFYNFRGDRPRELCRAFCEEGFKEFERGPRLDLFFAGLTQYQKGLPIEVILEKPPKMVNILGQYVSDLGIPQFRSAETEKYPHVTFFFNDYREEPFHGEERAVVPSPKVTTYDLQPEMSAPGVTEVAKAAILSGRFGLLVVNYANPDMVGHTGNIEAVKKAVETVDTGVQQLVDAMISVGGRAVITADHGNAEQLWDPVTNGPHTSHTLNLVEIYTVGKDCESLKLRESGRLADIAPTVLELMGLPQPAEMTGESLIAH